MQDVIPMCSFDASKSTKGASKLRRDLINAEIGQLRDLLPLPASTRQRLSQLQLMALVCVYVRKANYFQQVLKREQESLQHQQQAAAGQSSSGLLLPLLQQPQHQQRGHAHHIFSSPIPPFGFSKAMNGFLMMLTQSGKLLYISDNAAEYLGHSMEDLLIHGDSVYDMIDKQDHAAVQAELSRAVTLHGHALLGHSHQSTSADMDPNDTRLFLCRMNVSRNARRQMRFGDQKVILVEGKFASFLPLCSRNEPVLVGVCTPVAMPETRECVVQGATNMFTSHHSMDMTITTIDTNGEFYLGYNREELIGVSWYQLLHWDHAREAQAKHRMVTQSEQERSCIVLLRLQCRNGTWLWVHTVLQVKEASDPAQAPFIVATNQVLTEREAAVMRVNSWLYHYYLVHTKVQYGLAPPYDNPPSRGVSPFYSPQATSSTTPTPTTPLPSGSGGASASLTSIFQPHAHLLSSPHHHYHHPHLANPILENSPLSTTPYLSFTALHSPQQASSAGGLGFPHNGGSNVSATAPAHHVTQYSFTSSPGTYQHLSSAPSERGLLPNNPAMTPLVSPDGLPRTLPLLPLAPSPSPVVAKRKWEALGGELPIHSYHPRPKRSKNEAWNSWQFSYDSPEPSGDEDTFPVVPCFNRQDDNAGGVIVATHRTALTFSPRRSSKTASLTYSSSNSMAWPVSVPSPSPQRVPDTDNMTAWTLPVPQASPPCVLTPAATPTPTYMSLNHPRDIVPDTNMSTEPRLENQDILDTSWLSLWVPRLSDEAVPPSPSESPPPGMLPEPAQ